MSWYTLLKIADILEDSALKESIVTLASLIRRHDCPYSFAEAAMKAVSEGYIKLKRRGAANARELISLWYAVKKREERRKDPEELLRAG